MGSTRKGRCKVCDHPERVRIEDMRASGVTFAALEAKFGVPRATLHSHWHRHVGADRKLTFLVGATTIEQARERAAEEGGSVLSYLAITRSVLVGQLMAQAEANSASGVATIAGRLLDVLTALGKLSGEIQATAAPSTVINNTIGISAAPAFPDLMQGLLHISRAHPEARADIIALVDRLNGSPAPMPRPVAAIEHQAANV